MSSNYQPEVLDKEVIRKSLQRYYIRNAFDKDCTQLESGVCLIAEGDNSLDLSLEENYCWQLQELMRDYHQYRQQLLMTEDNEYLEQLVEVFEEEAIEILEFDCGHFDIKDGLHRLCIASKSEVPAYAVYKSKERYCPKCKDLKRRSELLEKRQFS
jgi:hypothetical protein